MSNDFCFAIINPLLRRVNQSCYVIVYWEMIYSTEHENLKRSRQTRLKNQWEINNRLMCNVMLILLEEQIKKSQWVIGHFKKLVGGKPKFPNVSQKTAVYSCRNIPKAFQDSFDRMFYCTVQAFSKASIKLSEVEMYWSVSLCTAWYTIMS